MKISERLTSYLKSWYATSIHNKREAGVEVTLTYSEFLNLFEVRQLASLEKAIEENRIRYQQDENNKFAYVLTWQSYAACSTNVFSRDTALICSRMKSATINLPQKGDKLRDSHCQNLSRSLTGKRKSEEHRKNISEGKKGRKIRGWTEERKAIRSAQRQAQEAAKRAVGGVV